MELETASAPRRYRMQARAAAAAATAEQILDATVEVFWEREGEQLSLDEVARRAGVTVRTVIRRFGGKEGLFAAAVDRETERVRRERERAPVGDVAAAVHVLVNSYEATGDRMLRVLAEEQRVPGLAVIVDRGRALHRDWCTRVFAVALTHRTGVQRERRLAQLVAICDLYTWKLLRRDAALSRRQAELAILELLAPILDAS
ncbi:MAG TPA: helix-turn-helix domain-containing protein [Solirubrobacteraceae bacterium]|jgi:AcrR family transcriptional regulator